MRLISIIAVALPLHACAALPARDGPDISGSSAVAAPRPPEPMLLRAADGTLCNAVRVGPTRAATAAHCLEAAGPFLLETGSERIPVNDAWSNPAYAVLDPAVGAAADIAVLRLASDGGGSAPVARIRPAPVMILARTPSGARESRACEFLGLAGGLIELSCEVPLGWSGAPVVQDGALVGIVSARGRGSTAGITQASDAFRIDSF